MQQLPSYLETARLRLRPLAESDLPEVFEYASDPEVVRYMDWPRHESISESRQWLQETLSEVGPETAWAIELRTPGGLCGIISVAQKGSTASLGYVLLARCWGQGIATEAGQAVVDAVFRQAGIDSLVATVDIDNHGSARVLKKLGFLRKKILKAHMLRPNMQGRPHRDTYFYVHSRSAKRGDAPSL